MTSERYASTRALHAAGDRRKTEMLEALEPFEVIAAFGACHGRWRLEVVQ